MIGVVVPAFKEHESIVDLVSSVRKSVTDALIVVVDDSPDDKTVEALRTIRGPSLHVIHRTVKGGRGSAVIEGLRYLRSRNVDWAVEMDADFSHPPGQLPQLIEDAKSRKLDLLIASRYLPESQILNWPLTRRAFSLASNQLARFLLNVPISDYTNGYRVYSAKSIDVIVNECGRLGTGFIALSEILVNVYYRGLRVGEIPTKFVNRVRGESSVDSGEIKNALTGLIKIRSLKNRLQRGEVGKLEARN